MKKSLTSIIALFCILIVNGCAKGTSNEDIATCIVCEKESKSLNSLGMCKECVLKEFAKEMDKEEAENIAVDEEEPLVEEVQQKSEVPKKEDTAVNKEQFPNRETDYPCYYCGEEDYYYNLEWDYNGLYHYHYTCYLKEFTCTNCGNIVDNPYEIHDGLCNDCEWNLAYVDEAECDYCGDLVDDSLAGKKCTECSDGYYYDIIP